MGLRVGFGWVAGGGVSMGPRVGWVGGLAGPWVPCCTINYKSYLHEEDGFMLHYACERPIRESTATFNFEKNNTCIPVKRLGSGHYWTGNSPQIYFLSSGKDLYYLLQAGAYAWVTKSSFH